MNERRSSNVLIALVLLAMLGPAVDAGAETLYVSPSGDDENPGTEERPLATPRGACRASRKRKAEWLTVVFRAGRYEFKRPLELSGADFACPVLWRAERPGSVRFTGGVRMPPTGGLDETDVNFTHIPAEKRRSVRVADLRKAGLTDYGVVSANHYGGPFMELVWDGWVQTLARWPDEGYTGIAAVESVGKDADGHELPQTKFMYEADRPSLWVDESDPYGNGFFGRNWHADRITIGRIDPTTKTIEQGVAKSTYGYSKEGFWFGFNLLCELDRPGEYYIDRKNGRLYFIPPTPNGRGELTCAVDLVILKGVSDFTLSGIVFENCRRDAIRAENCTNVVLSTCTVRCVSGAAVRFRGGRSCGVRRSEISCCGEEGICLEGGDPDSLEHSRHFSENNRIHDFSRAKMTYTPAIRFAGCGARAERNTIFNGPHVGLHFKGREHRIANNEFHHVCCDSGEMGAVYCGRDWTLCGNVIEANHFHDIASPRSQPNRAVMLDDGCGGITVVSNVVENVGEGISLSAIGNRIENNLFIGCARTITAWQKWSCPDDYKPGQYTMPQLLDRIHAIPVHEEPWKTRYPYLALVDDAIRTGTLRDPRTRTVIRNNIAVGCTNEFVIARIRKDPCTDEGWLIENNSKDPSCPPPGFGKLPPRSVMGATWLPVDGVAAETSPDIIVDCEFPGGNVKVCQVDGANGLVALDTDARGNGDWFWSYFRVRGAEGRSVHFNFVSDGGARQKRISRMGMLYSLDEGKTWAWTAPAGDHQDPFSFDFEFPKVGQSVRFATSYPYTQANLDAFIASVPREMPFTREVLTFSRKGRPVELLRIGNEPSAEWVIVLSARHHACESPASFVIEGFVREMLSDTPSGRWLRQHAHGIGVPFVDKDGVEDGDQGKGRIPHDHNRDYVQEIYPEVRAFKRLVQAEAKERKIVFFDLHAPTVRGTDERPRHDNIFSLGPYGEQAPRWDAYRKLLVKATRDDPIRYFAAWDEPWEVEYNQPSRDPRLLSSRLWVLTVPNVHLGSCWEIPFGRCGGVFSPAAAQILGRRMAQALVEGLR